MQGLNLFPFNMFMFDVISVNLWSNDFIKVNMVTLFLPTERETRVNSNKEGRESIYDQDK